ncbi:MBL fold metallo-hydrolase [Candidatus Bipolaricaulota bacterium]
MKTSALFVLTLLLAAATGFSSLGDQVTVTYLGHSCFTLQVGDGSVVMIDPYATYVPYPALPQPADVVLMTHAHVDHCPGSYGETNRYTGDPIEVFPWDNQGRIREGNWRLTDDLLVRFVEASHVTRTGGGEGYVSLFSFELGGLRFAHLGDLGRILTGAQITDLGDVDVLFIPVGGAYTIDAAEALTVIAQLPTVRIVFPMHYFVEDITPWPAISPLSDFTLVADALYDVIDQASSQIVIDSDSLPEVVEVWILEYLE